MDADIFIFEVFTNDIYNDMKLSMRNHLNLSDYPTNHPLHSTHNNKVMGKFKDEANGLPSEEFVGLK